MKYSDEQIFDLVSKIAGGLPTPKETHSIAYRQDYDDFRCIFTDETRVDLRRKLVETLLEQDEKDARREVEYLMTNAIPLEDWEKEEAQLDQAVRNEKDERIELENDID